MTSRLDPRDVDQVQYVDVQAQWLGVNISDANGGSFLAPIVWVSNIGLINWFFRFAAVTSSGTSGSFKLLVPDLKDFPAQRCGVYHQLNVLTPVLLQPGATQAEMQATMILTQGSQCAFRAMVSPDLLNY